MFYQRTTLLRDLLLFFYALFLFGSTFSIALAQIGLGFAAVLFIALAVTRRYNPFAGSIKWFYAFVGLYIVWMLIAAWVGQTPLRSTLILKEEWLFIAIPIGIYLLDKERYRRRLLAVFGVGVGIFTLYGVVQLITGVHWFKTVAPNPGPEFGYVVKGNFPSPMTFGNYFATASAFLGFLALTGWKTMSGKVRLMMTAVCLLGLISVIGSYNRGALLGLFLCALAVGWMLRNSKLLLTVAAVTVIGIVTVVSSPAVSNRVRTHLKNQLDPEFLGGRVFIWDKSIRIAASNPVFGVGQGNYAVEFAELLGPDAPGIRYRVHAHNDFLNIAAISGVPGMLFFCGIWVTVMVFTVRGWRRADPLIDRRLSVAALAGSLVFLVTSLTESTFADEEVRQMLMFVWATGLWQGCHPGGPKPGTPPLDSGKSP